MVIFLWVLTGLLSMSVLTNWIGASTGGLEKGPGACAGDAVISTVLIVVILMFLLGGNPTW